ncbi:MAG: type I-E CRISPR-associated protein Cas6/Cse3/CasE [Sulfuritalea sp.]|jgi:CRISPR-associated protein Cas6/Cse3/CasE subtype I-E|nr:type I-E CRISPR-associated protein Cas6/Cse3/CasE [Sulfuritalea sp.]
MDYAMQKPPSVRGYALHRIAAGLADGEKVLFADCGDHLLLRTSKPLDVDRRKVRTITAGDIVGFELRACVGKKVKGKHRYFHSSDWRSRHDWLERQGEAHGFGIITLHCTTQLQTVKAGDREFTVDQTDFTGVLKVTDAERFNSAVANGVGNKAKAFGFGMLVI